MSELSLPHKIDFYEATRVDQPIDGFEVSPVRKEDGDWTVCEESEAEMWSVYAHFVEGGVDCLADCETKEAALQLENILIAVAKHFVR